MQTTIVTKDADLADIRSDLEKVYEVSAYLDFPFSLDEVTNYFLRNRNITSEKLRFMISNGDFANIPFQIKDGYILTRASQSETLRFEREQISGEKLQSAARFARILTKIVPFIRTVAVTGSVAYGSAGRWDDIDLFVVTERKRLWLSVLMALAMVRVEKLLGLAPSHLLPFCLSYVHDEQGFAEDASRNRVNPLFARELLKAKPVAGPEQYRLILQENDWVGELYSAPYAAALKALDQGPLNGVQPRVDQPGLFALFFDWAEGIVYVFLSRYLKLRAYLTNLKLKSQKQKLRIFEPRITPNSCVYTSNFYRWLHSLWGER